MYDRYLQKANDLWDEFTTGRKSKNSAIMNSIMKEIKEGGQSDNQVPSHKRNHLIYPKTE